jgi:RHS repeat-associated protein
MGMPGRSYFAGNSYRYGFNGKEKDKDINSLTAYDYGFRVYNPGIGKFLSTDPAAQEFPWNSPYTYAEDGPVRYIDLDGFEKASPEQLELARTYADVFRSGIIKRSALLKITTDKEKIEELKKDLEIGKQEYGKWIAFIYKNSPQDAEKAIAEVNTAIESALAAIDLTPVGDIHTVATGKNLQGEKQSRAVSAGFLILDIFGGEEIKFAGKAGKFTLSSIAAGLKYANEYGFCEKYASEFLTKLGSTLKKAKAEVKIFEINIGKNGLIGTATKNYAVNGYHRFVEVVKDGKTFIFDNLNPRGVLKEDYVKSIGGSIPGKTFEGEELFKDHVKEIVK